MSTTQPTALLPDLDSASPGVWRYASLLGVDVPHARRVALGEGFTPLQRVTVGPGRALWLLRDDLGPNGSHKDRSLAVQVSAHAARGARTLVLSSSGNAAISAAAACRVAGLRLVALVSPLTPAGKVAVIARWGATVIRTPRAPALCRELSEALGAPDARPSVDDLALHGYRTLAYELEERHRGWDAVFVYATSGSTICGMAAGHAVLGARGVDAASPPLHAAQAGATARLARAFGHEPPESTPERSIVRDLGARHSRRHGDVVRALRASGGSAWHATDAQILAARELLLDQGVHVGLETACSVACALLAMDAGATQLPVIVASGHYGHEASEDDVGVIAVDTLDAALVALRGLGVEGA